MYQGAFLVYYLLHDGCVCVCVCVCMVRTLTDSSIGFFQLKWHVCDDPTSAMCCHSLGVGCTEPCRNKSCVMSLQVLLVAADVHKCHTSLLDKHCSQSVSKTHTQHNSHNSCGNIKSSPAYDRLARAPKKAVRLGVGVTCPVPTFFSGSLYKCRRQLVD